MNATMVPADRTTARGFSPSNCSTSFTRSKNARGSRGGSRRKPLTDLGLASLLRPYGIRSSTVRVEDASGKTVRGKGYFLRSFEDVFSRYLPIPGVSTRAAVPNAANTGENEVF